MKPQKIYWPLVGYAVMLAAAAEAREHKLRDRIRDLVERLTPDPAAPTVIHVPFFQTTWRELPTRIVEGIAVGLAVAIVVGVWRTIIMHRRKE